MSAIETAKVRQSGLIFVFLDITEAYDRIDRPKLWQTSEN